MNARIQLITALVLSLTASIVDAKDLYVDRAAGNDVTTYEGNSATNPWASIGRAAWGSASRSSPNGSQAARAGDRVIVRAGTYATAGTDVRYDPAYNPVNSGTAAQPITFEAEGVVTLTLSSSRGPVIGANDRDYIVWKGFSINEASARSRPDTGPVVLWSTVGSAIEDCTIDGNGDPGYGDNHPGIRAEGSSQLRIRNNTIRNFRTSVVNGVNGAAVQFYTTGAVLVENNSLADSGSGVWIKAPMEQTDYYEIRNNLIQNTGKGIAVHRSPNTASAPVRVYQNIIANSDQGVVIWMFDAATGPRHVRVVNNTIYGGRVGLFVNGEVVSGAGHMFWNNIVANTGEYAVNWAAPIAAMTSDRLDVEHNLYAGFGRFAIVWDRDYTLSNWQSNFNQDSATPVSTSADPLFAGASTGDFRLQPSSSARTRGVDIFDLNGNGSTTDTVPVGAYVRGNEVIGRMAGPAVPLPRSPDEVQAR